MCSFHKVGVRMLLACVGLHIDAGALEEVPSLGTQWKLVTQLFVLSELLLPRGEK